MNLRLKSILGNFKIEDYTLEYEDFIARFFNMCIDEGMEYGKIVPSRAFCSDESQGFPIIIITKHFGAFPFDHGLVGGIMAKGRNLAYAHHGKDLAIFQASHVGYDAETGHFGKYRRLQTADSHMSSNCGKVHAVLDWYQAEYDFAKENTLLQIVDNKHYITIDKQLLDQEYEEGIFLDISLLIQAPKEGGSREPDKILSTSKVFRASDELISFLKERSFNWVEEYPKPIGRFLKPELFTFKRNIEEVDHVGNNLHEYMPWIVTSREPMLSAAEVNVQIEFDKSYRRIVKEPAYEGRNLIYIAGLNIDYSPEEGQLFSKTQFVPWAAYLQHEDGTHEVIEQDALYDRLLSCDNHNPHTADMSEALGQ
ncbi:MAG TPA: hypothetical protein ENI84_02635 [Thiothrix sp.]|nr:hypothetical protein [Thiothrix sp.]